jgi:hypothetical protein
MTEYLGKKITVADSTATIGALWEISAPEISIDEIETTVYSDSYWKTFTAGLKDGGTLGLTVIYDSADASMNRLYNRAIGDPSLNTDTYTITFPDTKTMVFTGIITGVPIETPKEEKVFMSFNIKVSGAITGTLGT